MIHGLKFFSREDIVNNILLLSLFFMLQIILDVETKKAFHEVGGNFPDRLGISFVGINIRD